MQIKNVRIQNFRSIVDLSLSLDKTTVLIGANNSGKSAILEAVRIALSRRWGQRGTGFTENDIHLSDSDSDPRTAPAVRIQIVFEEHTAGDWPEDMVSDLNDICALTAEGLNRVAFDLTYTWNAVKEIFEPAWEFLNAEGVALPPKKRAINLSGFYTYVLFFWLGALRDADSEFTPRSRYWGGLLRSINLPKALEQEIKEKLDDLDAKLLAADPRFAKIAETIGHATEVAAGDTPGTARLRMLPMSLSDLLARAGVVLRNELSLPWLPLDHHGQGLQSLAVIFLMQAATSQTLSEENPEGAEPIFAIEEPEVHLHPQAARTLWQHISKLPGQKIVTTHSPYFVQHVPLRNIRLVRSEGSTTTVAAMPKSIASVLPWTPEIDALVSGRRLSQFKKDEKTGSVAATVWFDEGLEEALAACWARSPEAVEMNCKVKEFRHACRVLLSKEDETDLALLGRRTRGEMFFARRWILVEGQSDYLLIHAIGVALGYDLDQHGVAVIDFQNNGSPGVYAGLADAFSIPWNMLSDGDAESEKFRAQLLKRGFSNDDLTGRVSSLPTPNDLEDQLLADGHEPLLREVLARVGGESARTCPLDEFTRRLKNKKAAYMTELAPMVAADPALAKRMPCQFVETIERLKGATT